MMSRRSCLLALAAGLAVFLLAASGLVLWSQRGPGLRNEADRLASVIELRPGMTCAEIGAGRGRMAVRMAQHLGPSGHLYATEMEDEKLRAIRSAASDAGVANIAVIRAGEHSANLPDNCCDVIYMRRVYHHLSDAAAINRTLYNAIRPGGRLAVIDFLSPRWMLFLHHGIRSDVLVSQVTAAGFILERRIDGWSPIDYCLIFRKRVLSGSAHSAGLAASAAHDHAFSTKTPSRDFTFRAAKGQAARPMRQNVAG